MEIDSLYRFFLECTSVTTDSRNCPKGSMFFALKGDSFNGNAFAAKALELGSSYVVVDEATYIPAQDSRYLLVNNCLQALQQLAHHHRLQLGTSLIAITGSNGKTTTKELMAAVLSQQYNVLYTQGNLNNHIGVPLTLLRLKPEHNFGIIEMGANHPGEIRTLAEITEPNFGIITNVGKAHLEGFGSFEGVIKAKGELYDYLRRRDPHSTIFIHKENPYLKDIAGELKQIDYSCTDNQQSYVRGFIPPHAATSPFLSFCWIGDKTPCSHNVTTQLVGEYNFANAMAAVAVGSFFGIEAEQIDKALREYAPLNNRSRLTKTARNTLVIDAYNANPTSMAASLTNFHKMEAEQKVLILGDMRELGEDGPEEHQKIVDYLEECGFKQVILVGELFAATRHSYITYPDTATLAAYLQTVKLSEKTIFIKGSNGIGLSAIVEYL